ncbi:MAG: hypothetical protein JNJ73_02015 [Hyphomonadaceae bacterium]|nr:hypothetical protein [Hyphomonadaceae bacterium]
MSTEDNSITDEPEDTPQPDEATEAPRAPLRPPQPSPLDQALLARGRQKIPQPPVVPASRIVETPPIDFAGGALESTLVGTIDPLGFARDALDAANKDWETIKASAADLSIDTVTLSRFAKPAFDRAVRRLEAAEQKANERFLGQISEIHGVLFAKQPDAKATEVRAYFRSHGKSAATEIMRALNDTRDIFVASAVFSAPPFLSGISNEERTRLETFAEKVLCPETCVERDQAEKARDTLKRCRERMQRTIGSKLAVWAGESGALKALRLAAEQR